MAYNWWLTPAVYAGISVVLLEARLHRAASQGKKLIFRGAWSLKLLYGGGAAAIAVLLFQKWLETPFWAVTGLVVLVTCCLFGWPKTIVTDEYGIECHWWWRRRITIPWNEVDFAESGTAGAIEVVGRNARIVFEGYNADPERFCKEVIKRSSVKKIMSPGEFTGLHLN